MRTITVSSLFGFAALALLTLLMAGCPPSYFDTCEGAECWQPEGDGGREADVPPDPRPKITSVVIPQNPSRMIRQGFGGEPTNRASEVHLTGERLDEVTAVAVGTGPNALNGLILSKTSAELVFTIVVGHGAPIGSHAITLTAPLGSATFADAISITGITAAPAGNDSLEIGLDSTGTDAHPFRSLRKATELAMATDTIALKNGIYDTTHGEIFAKNGTNVPADLTIRGESMEGTFLVGLGITDTYIGTALSLVGNAHIETLGILGFSFAGIETAKTGKVTIKAVHIYGVQEAGVAANTETFLDSVDISANIDAVRSKDAKVTIADSHIHHSATGIYAMGGTLTVTGSEIDHICCYTRDDRDSAAAINTSVPTTLTNVRIHNSETIGVEFAAFNHPLVMTHATFSANGEAVRLHGSASVKVRDSIFLADNKILIHVLSRGQTGIDLGTPGPGAGNNEFRICYTCDGIVDSSGASSGEAKPITVFGNAWHLYDSPPASNGPAGCSESSYPKWGPPRYWHIENPGKCPSTGNVILN